MNEKKEQEESANNNNHINNNANKFLDYENFSQFYDVIKFTFIKI